MPLEPNFKAMAEDLCSLSTPLIEAVLIRQKVAELQEWHDQIRTRNQRIAVLESLLARASVYVSAEAKGREMPEDKDFARFLIREIDAVLKTARYGGLDHDHR